MITIIDHPKSIPTLLLWWSMIIIWCSISTTNHKNINHTISWCWIWLMLPTSFTNQLQHQPTRITNEKIQWVLTILSPTLDHSLTDIHHHLSTRWSTVSPSVTVLVYNLNYSPTSLSTLHHPWIAILRLWRPTIIDHHYHQTFIIIYPINHHQPLHSHNESWWTITINNPY